MVLFPETSVCLHWNTGLNGLNVFLATGQVAVSDSLLLILGRTQGQRTRIQNHNKQTLTGFALRRHKSKHNSHNFGIQLSLWLPEAAVPASLQRQGGTTTTTHLPFSWLFLFSVQSQDLTQYVSLQLQAPSQHQTANQGPVVFASFRQELASGPKTFCFSVCISRTGRCNTPFQ